MESGGKFHTNADILEECKERISNPLDQTVFCYALAVWETYQANNCLIQAETSTDDTDYEQISEDHHYNATWWKEAGDKISVERIHQRFKQVMEEEGYEQTDLSEPGLRTGDQGPISEDSPKYN